MIDFGRVANNFLAIFIMLGFFLIIVAQMRKQPISETIKDMVKLFKGDKDGSKSDERHYR